MRSVALALVSLFLATSLLPLVAADVPDECASHAPLCLDVAIPPNPANANTQHVFVYAAALTCNPGDGPCTGAPPAKALGLVWQDTNSAKGLQRSKGSGYVADLPLLV